MLNFPLHLICKTILVVIYLDKTILSGLHDFVRLDQYFSYYESIDYIETQVESECIGSQVDRHSLSVHKEKSTDSNNAAQRLSNFAIWSEFGPFTRIYMLYYTREATNTSTCRLRAT